MKTCTKCGGEKPLDEFFRDARKRDGRYSHCKVCQRAASRDWKARNRERRDEYRAAYYEAHGVRERANHIAWLSVNRDRATELQRHRNARKREAFVAEVVADEILRRDAGRCGICGDPVEANYEIDHVVPLSRGGMHGPENVQVAHPTCNRRKWAKAA